MPLPEGVLIADSNGRKRKFILIGDDDVDGRVEAVVVVESASRQD